MMTRGNPEGERLQHSSFQMLGSSVVEMSAVLIFILNTSTHGAKSTTHPPMVHLLTVILVELLFVQR